MPITNIGLPTSFVPTSIAGCQVWFDGKDPAGTGTAPAAGSAIITWADKSGNNYNATSPSATKATYGSNGGLLFVGGNGNGNSYNSGSYYSTSYTAAPTNESVFIVYNLTDTTNQFFFTGLQSGGRSISLYNSSPQVFAIGVVGVSWGAVYSSLQMAARTTYIGVAVTSGGTNTYAGVNGVTTLTGPTVIGGYTAGTTTVIGAALGNQLFTNGFIYEIIAYNSVLSADQRQQVEKYLAWKWNTPSVLPTTHIGYKGPPVAFGKVPYYTAFSPLSIPTCALWLDAADSTTVTGTTTVTAWSDKSGNGRPVTITSAPSYGTTTQNKLKTLAFNNNQVTTSIASAVGTGDFTLIAVWYQSTGGTNTVLSLGTSGSSSQSLGYSATKYNFYQFGSAQESAYTTSAGSWVIQIGTRISSVKTVYINGVAGTTPSTDSYNQTVTTVTIGRGDSFGITGQIGEILVYTGTMGQTDQQKIESYLAQKWNLTAQLPLTHLNTTKPAGLPAGVPRVLLLFTALSSFMSTYYNLSGAYALANIADSVTSLSATPAYVWTVSVPSAAKGKNGILAVFFNLFSSGQFAANQYFDYGVYVDGVSQMLGDSSGTLRYVQTALGTYAMSSGGISYGANGLVNGLPLFIPVSFAASASQIQIGLKNSSAQMTPISSQVIAYSSNIITSSGTSNTGNFVPINTFSNIGTSYYTVPTTCSIGTVTGVFIYCWGAGGNDFGSSDKGGTGGFSGGYYAVAGGTTLAMVVGRVGQATSPSIAFGGGGASANGSGKGGGGFSGLFLSNAGGIVQSNAIVIAGGGGACGQSSASGGFGGYPSGGTTTNWNPACTGGSQTNGGIGTGQNGSALQGGNGQGNYGNGGGGGWYGGGANTDPGGWSPGGGGSGYIGNINGATGGIGLTSSAVTSNGMTYSNAGSPNPLLPGGTTSSFYPFGSLLGQNNQSGLVVIVPAVGTAATQIGVSAALYSG